MFRLIKALFVLSTGSWFSLASVPQLAAQQSIELPGETIRIVDFGLERRIPSAIDLVGPETGSAGRYRDALVRALQCWIDGVEGCAAADRNDPRVRAIRRFLAQDDGARAGAITVEFPDRTRIQVRVQRLTDLGPDDWDRRAYASEVLTGTVRAPGLAAVPTRPGQFEGFAYEGSPEIEAALMRLKQRLDVSPEPARIEIERPALAGDQAL